VQPRRVPVADVLSFTMDRSVRIRSIDSDYVLSRSPDKSLLIKGFWG
jgi:hypothetical protein